MIMKPFIFLFTVVLLLLMIVSCGENELGESLKDVEWGSVVKISEYANAQMPRVSWHNSEVANVVWERNDYVRYNYYQAGWNEDSELSGFNQSSLSLQLASNGNGTSFSVWAGGATYSNIYAAKYSTSTGWNTAVVLSDDGGNFFDHTPDIAVDAEGNAMAVWYVTYDLLSDPNYHEVWGRRYDASLDQWEAIDLTFQQPKPAISNRYDGFVTTPLSFSEPKVAADQEGNFIAVWRENDHIWFNRYILDSGWSGYQTVSNDTGYGEIDSKHKIVMNKGGEAFVVFNREISANFTIKAVRFDGAAWIYEATVLNTNEPSNPDVAMSDSGDAVVVSDLQSGMGFTINRYQKSLNTWLGELHLHSSVSNISYPKVVMDEQGHIVVVWIQDGDIFGTVHESNNTWEPDKFTDPYKIWSGSINTEPYVAVNDNYQGIVTWEESNSDIYAAYFQ